MPGKKILFLIAVIFALPASFWLGRVTGRGGRETGGLSHQDAPANQGESTPETAPHGHEEGTADAHADGKDAAGLKLTPEEMRNIGLKTVSADLRPIESVIRTAGVVKSHPDGEAQVSSRVSGKIVSLLAKVGDAVQKGQKLAEIQSAEIQKLQVDLVQAENRLILHKA